jgi:hypothetical protein
MDALMALLIIMDKTRSIALLLCTIFQGLALVQRPATGKESLPDALICALSATAYFSATI